MPRRRQRSPSPRCPAEVEPVPLGHLRVEDGEVQRRSGARGAAQRRETGVRARRLLHGHAFGAQHVAQDAPVGLVVIHDEEPAAAERFGPPGSGGFGGRYLGWESERKAELAAAPRLASDRQRAAHQGHESPRDREPEAGAAVAARRGSVRLSELVEDGGQLFLRDADPRVAHPKPHRRPVAVVADYGGGDVHLALLGELDGVPDQVHQDLTHARGIAAHEVRHVGRGDPTRVRQVLMNLIGNAIKFTEQGEVDVSAAVVGHHGDRTSVRFRVRDTGIGISQEQLATIFDEFTQADASTTRRYGGTGLGLAISRRLVALMGGALAVTSEPGRGSEFSFTLTLPTEVPAAEAAAPGRAESLGGRRLLVVDDNETNRRILRDMLGAEGVAVQEVSRADAGLAALRRAASAGTPLDLAILDAQMPERDGF